MCYSECYYQAQNANTCISCVKYQNIAESTLIIISHMRLAG